MFAADDQNAGILESLNELLPHGHSHPANRRGIGKVPQIRFGDRVVVAEFQLKVGELGPRTGGSSGGGIQLAWIKVWSLMSFGMVTGHVIQICRRVRYRLGCQVYARRIDCLSRDTCIGSHSWGSMVKQNKPTMIQQISKQASQTSEFMGSW